MRTTGGHARQQPHQGRTTIVARAVAAMLAVVGCCSGLAVARASASAAPDAFTPVTASSLTRSTTAVLGTDGRYHVVYELELTNTKQATATIRSVVVRDASRRSRVLVRYRGRQVVAHLRTTLPTPAANAKIGPNQQRLLYIELSFAKRSQVPRMVVHTLTVLAAANPGTTKPTPLRYAVAPFAIRRTTPVVLGPPLRGSGWVATNGCCNAEIVHRGSVQSVNGGLFDGQRFAIDWQRIDPEGRFVSGDPGDVHNYHDYGADVLAVANGRVVSTLSTLPDQTPGTLPDPSTITLQTVDGNHVVLAIGHGRYVFYGHLERGSVTVRPGQRVRRGQLLGRLGNSGNTSAPHLHLHVIDGPSVLGSNGLPYVINGFALAGQVSIKAFNARTSNGVEGSFPRTLRSTPAQRHDQFPLNLNIVDFR